MSLQTLIVEDELIVASDLRELIAELGHRRPRIAKSPDDALETMDREPVDLVLMDINLEAPMDGIELTKKMKREYSPEVLYITAYSDEQTLDRARDTDALGYLVKPIAADTLGKMLQSIQGAEGQNGVRSNQGEFF